MDWTSGTPNGGGQEKIERISMLRRLLAELIPAVCECLGLFPTFLSTYLLSIDEISPKDVVTIFQNRNFLSKSHFLVEVIFLKGLFVLFGKFSNYSS